MSVQTRPSVCNMCRKPATEYTVDGVSFINCQTCDRSRCKKCTALVTDPFAKRCPAGHQLKWT